VIHSARGLGALLERGPRVLALGKSNSEELLASRVAGAMPFLETEGPQLLARARFNSIEHE